NFDSVHYYSGEITQGALLIPARTNSNFGKLNLSGNRLFPTWDGTQSVTQVDYYISTPAPHGARITLSAGDLLTFTITPVAVSFSQFKGTMRQAYTKASDTQFVPVSCPWKKEAVDSLRGKFFFNRVVSHINDSVGMPGPSWIERFQMHIDIFDPKNKADVSDTTAEFADVRNTERDSLNLAVTKVINHFPDTIAIVLKSTIPINTKIIAINDNKPSTGGDLGGMTIHTFTNYVISAFFDWHITDTAFMDLGSTNFHIDSSLDFTVGIFKKMADRSAGFDMNIFNNTNVTARLFALVAPGQMRFQIDSLSSSQFINMVKTPGKAELSGYVNILGAGGILIPPRDSTVHNSVMLDDAQIDPMLSADTSRMRWGMEFLPKSNDALADTDYVKINSWLTIEGLNSFGSLINGNKK
ncbi:MAG: hypothetical protein PHC61_08070, partial [Chitinivibrionales bacterium]|nr:hypothetical protein [Chitinivibrionales bacterium]